VRFLNHEVGGLVDVVLDREPIRTYCLEEDIKGIPWI
jgi:hypothetical protein